MLCGLHDHINYLCYGYDMSMIGNRDGAHEDVDVDVDVDQREGECNGRTCRWLVL